MPRKTDFSELKQQAAGRWKEILIAVGGCPVDILDGKHHPCPKCGGTDRFRLVDEAEGALLCNQCFSKRNGDGISAVAWLKDCSLAEAAALIAAHLGLEWAGRSKAAAPARRSKAKAAKGEEKSGGIYLSIETIVAGVAQGHPRKKGEVGLVELVATYDYGPFRVLRIELPTPAGEKRRKTFLPVYPEAREDGVTLWRKGYPPSDSLRPLFRLAELMAADPAMVVVCGGEKAALAAAGVGLTSTTNAGGEKAIVQTDWGPLARFAQVVVCRDNDPAGVVFGELVAAALARLEPAPRVKVLLLPDLPPKGDIVEWIAAGGTREAFLRLAAEAGEHTPDPLAIQRAICEELHMDVLGELPEQGIRCFSKDYAKNVTIDRVSKLTYVDLIQMFGPIVIEKVYAGKDELPHGMRSLSQIKELIALLGGTERAGRGIECGQGVWLGSGEEMVCVGRGQALLWDGQKLSVSRVPRVAGLKIDMDVAVEEAWFDAERLGHYIRQAADPKWAVSVFDRCSEFFRNWYWHGDPSGCIPELLTGLTLATWVQSTWPWRPHVGIPAASDSGKSYLFAALEAVYGNLAILSAKSTEAGIRQAVAQHAKVILCDEFENDRHRKAILEFWRTASTGSKTLRGSSHQESGARQYGLRHICWATSIELGLTRQADRNRFVVLELDPPPPEKRGKLKLPKAKELADFGQQLLAVALVAAKRAREIFEEIRGVHIHHVFGRAIDTWGIPTAMVVAAASYPPEKAKELLEVYFRDIEQDASQGTKDHVHLFGDLLAAQVRLDGGKTASVEQLLLKPKDYSKGWDALAREGIKIIGKTRYANVEENEEERRGLFIADRAARLLRGTEWEGQTIHTLLRRLDPKAKRDQQRVVGQYPWGVEVPWEYIRAKFFREEDAF